MFAAGGELHEWADRDCLTDEEDGLLQDSDSSSEAESAAKSVENLPLSLMQGAVGDPRILPGVLDFLSRKHARDTDFLMLLVAHPGVSDETLASVARVCRERVCEAIADNQKAWLRTPAIVEALYGNSNTRQSLIHRMFELAEREVTLQYKHHL